MAFRIEYAKTPREAFGAYQYDIYEDDRLIAQYWHDYRGDEHGIAFVGGTSELWPVGRMTDFIEGGGPEPLALSERAVEYLTMKVGR